MAPPTTHRISAATRRRTLTFLLSRAADLSLPPLTTHTALSLFSTRFLPSLSSPSLSHPPNCWLLKPPIQPATLNIFALISLLISSKLHSSPSSPPLSIPDSLKPLSDLSIPDQLFTLPDLIEAETTFLKLIHFTVLSSSFPFLILEDLVSKLRDLSKVGELISLDSCLDLLEVIHEDEEEALRIIVGNDARCLAAGVVVAGFLVSVVPEQRSEFPVLAWVCRETRCREKDVVAVVEAVLRRVMKTV